MQKKIITSVIAIFTLFALLMVLPGWASNSKKSVKNLQGWLEIRAGISRDNKNEKIQYLFLSKKDHHYYQLHFSDHVPKGLIGGAPIKIKHAYEVRTLNNTKEFLLTAADIQLEKTAMTTVNTVGPQKTMVFLINFQDNTAQPFTAAQVNSTVFNTSSNMYLEFSSQHTSIVGDVIGYYTLAMSGTGDCTNLPTQVTSLAQAAAANAGVDLSSYTHQVFLFPLNSNCAWGGLATVGNSGGGNYGVVWLNGWLDTYPVGHELGHNLGMWHSNSYVCTASPISGCTSVEYGDNTDIMGGGSPTGHFNACQKEVLGWLSNTGFPSIQTVTTSGTYNIDAYETQNMNVKALKVLKANNSDGSQDYYYLEARKGIGFDTFLADCIGCNFTQGVDIHIGNTVNSDSAIHLIDMTYNDGNPNNVALLAGQSFVDATAANNGVTFTVNSVTANGATVTILIGSNPPPVCTHNPASISISPTTTTPVNAGSSAVYAISITNNDTSACSPTNFTLTPSVQTSLVRASLDKTALTINAGANATANLTMLTSVAAQSGAYSDRVAITNSVNATVTTLTANLSVN